MGHENVWVPSLRGGKGELHKKCHPSILEAAFVTTRMLLETSCTQCGPLIVIEVHIGSDFTHVGE